MYHNASPHVIETDDILAAHELSVETHPSGRKFLHAILELVPDAMKSHTIPTAEEDPRFKDIEHSLYVTNGVNHTMLHQTHGYPPQDEAAKTEAEQRGETSPYVSSTAQAWDAAHAYHAEHAPDASAVHAPTADASFVDANRESAAGISSPMVDTSASDVYPRDAHPVEEIGPVAENSLAMPTDVRAISLPGKASTKQATEESKV